MLSKSLRSAVVKVLLATLITGLLAACGQKGPLRRPDPPAKTVVTAAAAADAVDPSALASRRQNPHE